MKLLVWEYISIDILFGVGISKRRDQQCNPALNVFSKISDCCPQFSDLEAVRPLTFKIC